MSKKPVTNAGIRTVTAVTMFHGGVKVKYLVEVTVVTKY